MGELNRRYFEALMADKQLSMRGLAAKMSMGHSQLSLTFSGARKLQLDEAAQMSNIFGVPIHEIVENAGVLVRPTSGRRVSVIGAMRGDGTVDVYGPDIVERVASPGDLPDGAVAIQARTAGSALDWTDGWVMFCKGHNGMDPAILGRLCYAKIAGGPAVVAMVKRGYQEGTHNLSGPYIRESCTIEWATPVIVTRN